MTIIYLFSTLRSSLAVAWCNSVTSMTLDNSDNINNVSNIDNQIVDNNHRKPKFKKLSDSQKLIIKAKFQSGVPMSDLSKEFNTSYQSIHSVISNKKFEIMEKKHLENLKKSLISHAYANAFQAQDSVTKEKMESASLVQLGVFSKISIEVARLLEEKSTQNIAIHSLNQTIDDELKDLREKIYNLDNNIPIYAHSPNKRTINNDDEKKDE